MSVHQGDNYYSFWDFAFLEDNLLFNSLILIPGVIDLSYSQGLSSAKTRFEQTRFVMAKKAVIKRAMKHPDILGAGAKKRKKLKSKDKIKVVMSEFKRGTLYSGSGRKVKSRKQAVAIALDSARRLGAKIKKKK